MNQQSSESLHKTISILREVAQRLESGDIIERPKSFDELADLCKAQARKDHQHRVLCEYQQAVRRQVEEVTERTGINFNHLYPDALQQVVDRHNARGGRWRGECGGCGRPSYGNTFCADCEAMGYWGGVER